MMINFSIEPNYSNNSVFDKIPTLSGEQTVTFNVYIDITSGNAPDSIKKNLIEILELKHEGNPSQLVIKLHLLDKRVHSRAVVYDIHRLKKDVDILTEMLAYYKYNPKTPDSVRKDIFVLYNFRMFKQRIDALSKVIREHSSDPEDYHAVYSNAYTTAFKDLYYNKQTSSFKTIDVTISLNKYPSKIIPGSYFINFNEEQLNTMFKKQTKKRPIKK